MLDIGFPRADVENDFLRARRRQFLATLATACAAGAATATASCHWMRLPTHWTGAASGSRDCRRSG
jgi:hypothetical protein